MDISRRLFVKALSLASSMVTTPAAALASSAVAAATAAIPTAAALGVQSGANPMDVSVSRISPIQQALELLYQEERHQSIAYSNPHEVRPSISCFRSASPMIKFVWERMEERRDNANRRIFDAARGLLESGKITL